MAKIQKITPQHKGHVYYIFMCPGCNSPHTFNDTWQFNGDIEKPTVSPSLLVTYPPDSALKDRCHSFIKDGMIQFLNDCTHELKGQTVELPEIKE